jgi:hypothetical protein
MYSIFPLIRGNLQIELQQGISEFRLSDKKQTALDEISRKVMSLRLRYQKIPCKFDKNRALNRLRSERLYSVSIVHRFDMSLKFSSRIQSVQDGQAIFITGKAAECAGRFDIDLSSGTGTDLKCENIQFHMSVRFVEGKIVRNTHTSGRGWGIEEREENLIPYSCANPIKRGEDFKIAIYVDTKAFFVTINEKPFCVFPHRMPLNEIQNLTVWRDVETVYRVDHVTAPPKSWPLTNNRTFTGLMPKQLKAGNVVVVTATPKSCGDFTFNLIQTETGRIFFHFRPYLNNARIVMNDQCDNLKWRSEVNTNSCAFPFSLNQKFKLAIVLDNSSFLIAVDGKIFAKFDYRDDNSTIFQSIGKLEIISRNNLEILSVNHMLIAPDCKGFETFSK